MPRIQSTAIWNSTALFCRDPSKATERLHFAYDLAAKVIILNIVEAHGQEGSEHTLRDRMKKSHLVKYFPGTSQAKGGVIICVKTRILTICGQPVAQVIDEGRVVCMKFTSKQERLGIISVRLDPHYTLEKQKRIIRQIAIQVHSCRDMSWLICGDFNFEVLGEIA